MNKLFFLIAIVAMSSCRVAPNRMFQTPKNYVYATDTVSGKQGPHLLAPEDRIDLHIFSNDGFKLVDITTSNLSETAQSEGISYKVEENGEIKLPVIGRVPLAGLSLKDAETFLEEKYSKYYHDPFVILTIVSHRAMVFLGDGKGTTVTLTNDNTTLFEVLAQAGGTTENSKAYKIKIIRGDLHNPQVFFADASTLEGLKNSELHILPNDIIYVESGGRFQRIVSADVVPYVTLLTSLFLLFSYINNTNN